MSAAEMPLRPGKFENWHQWRRVEHGKGCLASLPAEMKRLGVKRPFLLTTRSLRSEGALLNKVRDALGVPIVGQFWETTPHTPREVVLAAAAAVQASKPDCLVSFGGSTVTDTAKAAALAIAGSIATDAGFEPFKVKSEVQRTLAAAPLPHIALPTTLSGAEFSRDIGITNSNLRKKEIFRYDAISPQSILLDPVLTTATPQRLWASTGVKVMSDAIEQLYGRSSHPVVEALVLSAIGSFSTYLPLSEQADPELRLDARLRCQIASWMTLFAFHNAGTNVGLGGGLRHQLGGMARIPHGEATCVMLPHVLAFNAPAIPDGYERLATALGIDAKSLPRSELTAAVVRHIRELSRNLGLPDRLEPLGMKRADIPKMAAYVMQEASLQFNPRKVENEREVIALLEAAL